MTSFEERDRERRRKIERKKETIVSCRRRTEENPESLNIVFTLGSIKR